jgi:hypothetical protein
MLTPSLSHPWGAWHYAKAFDGKIGMMGLKSSKERIAKT